MDHSGVIFIKKGRYDFSCHSIPLFFNFILCNFLSHNTSYIQIINKLHKFQIKPSEYLLNACNIGKFFCNGGTGRVAYEE